MAQSVAAIALQLVDDEVSVASGEQAKYIEQQEDFAPTNDEPRRVYASTSPAQDHEQPEDPIALPKFDSAVLAGFRIGYRQDAASTAQKTLNAGATATQKILQMAGWVQSMKSRLDRKEFSRFVKDLLQWVGDEARKYLDIARAFEGFDLGRLQRLEPFTLLKLRSKRYSPLITRLRDEVSITQLRVQELISELLPKKPRKQKLVAADGNAVLEKHANTEDGTFYFTLKEANLSATIGSWLENKLESKTLGQVLSEAMQQQDEEEQISAMREQIQAEAERQARNRFEILEFGLKQQIAHLEAQLAAVKPSELGAPPATTTGREPVQVTEATLESTARAGREDAVASESIESATGLQASFDLEVPLESDQLNEYPDVQVAPLASIHPSEPPSYEPTETDSDYSEPVVEPNPQQSDEASTIFKQPLAADWDLIQQLRAAESSLQKIDTQIQNPYSPLAQSGSNTEALRELKQLRSDKVSEIVKLINSNGISAYYEEQPHSCRVVLTPKYASDLLMQAQSWSDVVLVVVSDGKQLLSTLKDWTLESRQLLVQLLSTYLETEPNALDQIDWIPGKLVVKALSTLSFRIRKIGGPNNLVDEPKLEYIPCSFVSLEYPGTAREQWVFQDTHGNNHPVFGRDEIEVEKF